MPLKKSVGLTLIEVLVALAIISIAMTAIIKAAAENIRATDYLQSKTLALWTGQLVMNEWRLGLQTIENRSDKLTESHVLSSTWYWQAEETETPNKKIKKLTVNVFAKNNPQASPTVTLTGYNYHAT
jgi:general secretion pathway protein I